MGNGEICSIVYATYKTLKNEGKLFLLKINFNKTGENDTFEMLHSLCYKGKKPLTVIKKSVLISVQEITEGMIIRLSFLKNIG